MVHYYLLFYILKMPEDNADPFTQGELATVNPKYTISNKLWSYLKSYRKTSNKGNDLVMGYLLK